MNYLPRKHISELAEAPVIDVDAQGSTKRTRTRCGLNEGVPNGERGLLMSRGLRSLCRLHMGTTRTN